MSPGTNIRGWGSTRLRIDMHEFKLVSKSQIKKKNLLEPWLQSHRHFEKYVFLAKDCALQFPLFLSCICNELRIGGKDSLAVRTEKFPLIQFCTRKHDKRETLLVTTLPSLQPLCMATARVRKSTVGPAQNKPGYSFRDARMSWSGRPSYTHSSSVGAWLLLIRSAMGSDVCVIPIQGLLSS